jgi:hypothetical protein
MDFFASPDKIEKNPEPRRSRFGPFLILGGFQTDTKRRVESGGATRFHRGRDNFLPDLMVSPWLHLPG